MHRPLTLVFCVVMMSMPMMAGQSIKIFPRTYPVNVDGSAEMAIKRMPEGSVFVLSVNKGQDVRGYDIQWFKDGEAIPGATDQELTYPIATEDMNGVYTVSMASPCAKVMSKPMHVIVERRSFQVNTEIGGGDGVAGHVQETITQNFVLNECQPNPVTDRATITFTSAATSDVTLKVVDLNGNVVATLVNDVLPAGTHSVQFSTTEHNMTSSLYYYVLSAPGFTDTKPLMLVK